MIYRVSRICRDARVALDLNNTNERLMLEGDADTLTLDEIIKSKVEDAVARVECAAPLHLLESGHPIEADVFWNPMHCGWLPLPDDFMRLVSFRMSDWERTVYVPLSESDAEYQLQSSRYKGIRGNPQKPTCAVVSRPEGLALEFYSCRSDEATVSRATYIPYPRIDKYGGIEISEKCYNAVVYMICTLVLVALGETERAASMTELSTAALV